VRRWQNVLITGPTDSGKTWLACALAQHACRKALSVLCSRAPRLLEELRMAHGDGNSVKAAALTPVVRFCPNAHSTMLISQAGAPQ
jgi:DNA replication protein DnaC